ncbi:oligosaccharide repeat unit polymerase [Vibrio anguillarum]|uniref:oligosaccharide repeat unit polymerase n=1 Tax=Vibrio TaxID=662 RepID=UPI002FE4489E
MKQRGEIYFHPIFIFIIGVNFFYVLPMFYYNEDYLFPLFILLLGCFSYVFGWYVNFNKKIPTFLKKDISHYIAVDLIFYFFLISTLLKLTEVSTYSNYSEIYAGRSESDIYYLLVSKFIDVVSLLSASLYASRSKRKYILVFIVYSFSELMSPTRLHFILIIIYWLCFGVSFRFIKIRIWHSVLGLASLPILFSFLLIKRLSSYSSESFLSSFSNLVKNLDILYLMKISIDSMETFQTYLTSKMIIESSFIHPESGIVRFIFMGIPRSVWSDKPEPMARLIAKQFYPEAYANGGGMVGGIFGDPYANAGILGIIMIWMGIGYLSRLTYNSTINSIYTGDNTGNVLKLLTYFIFVSYFIQCLRGFSSDLFWVYLYQTIIVIILSKMIKFK